MDKEPILWNDLIKITPKEYFKKYGYLFDKDEYLSDKLKKYNLNSALTDLKNSHELMHYHTFVAHARTFITNNITVYKLTNELIDVVQNVRSRRQNAGNRCSGSRANFAPCSICPQQEI
jgi:hypothetical protein